MMLVNQIESFIIDLRSYTSTCCYINVLRKSGKDLPAFYGKAVGGIYGKPLAGVRSIHAGPYQDNFEGI